ncbi:hypothetical protein [uncultured Draconibacterium sp.]|uniref:hypothetical protein n=1 Tax=uncultured Draconibacterium sp. TaxID=1573823 RepID=UPI003216796E
MKKSVLLNLFLSLFVITNAQFAHKNIGNSDLATEWAMVFEIEDEYNGRPLPGVTIELLDERSRVSIVKTDSHGRAIILVKNIKYFASDMLVKAYKDNYSGWSKQLGSQWDFISESKQKQFGLLPDDEDYRRQGILMNPKNMSDSDVIPKMLRGEFKYLKDSSSGYGRTNNSGLFVYNFSLNYDRHPSEDNVYHNSKHEHHSRNDIGKFVEEKDRKGKRGVITSYVQNGIVKYIQTEKYGTSDEVYKTILSQLPSSVEFQHVFISEIGDKFYSVYRLTKDYKVKVYAAGFGQSISDAKSNAISFWRQNYFYKYQKKEERSGHLNSN